MLMSRNNNVLDLMGPRTETREQVLERLFNEHGVALRAFLQARIGVHDDLEDLMQELFLKLAGMPDLFARIAPHSGSNRAFLLTTANNLMVDRERRQGRLHRQNVEHGEAAKDDVLEASPEKIAQANQELEIVLQAINSLRPNWRRAFVLNRFDNKSYPQIAAEMGVSVKQIEKYMSNALNRLREVARNIREAG